MCQHPLFSPTFPESEIFESNPYWMALAAVAGESVAESTVETVDKTRCNTNNSNSNTQQPGTPSSTQACKSPNLCTSCLANDSLRNESSQQDKLLNAEFLNKSNEQIKMGETFLLLHNLSTS
jgi:hypothetical protein